MKIILCTNPFDCGRDQKILHLAKGRPVGNLMKNRKLAGCFTVAVNGEALEREAGLAYIPKDGDDVMLVPELTNPALKTIAMIGVQIGAAFLVPGLGNFIGGTLFTSLTTVAQNAIAGALLSVAGSLAVGGVASLLQHTPGGNNYGVLGPSTVARSGVPIPKGYGTMRSGGNIVESWIDIQGNNGDQHDTDDGADTIGRQYINGRVDFGWGPAPTLPPILLNGQDINSYSDVAYLWRPGTKDQGAVLSTDPGWIIKNRTVTGDTQNLVPTTDFTTINNNYPQNKRIRCGIDTNYVIVPGQRDDTQKLTVFVTFPKGVWRYDDDMEIKRAAIDYDVYYRVAGSGDAGWVHVAGTTNDYTSSTHYYYNIRQTLLRQATIVDNLPSGRYDVKIVKNGAGAVHNPLDYFEHESNKWGDELWVESVQETSYTTMLYKHTIQLCFRIMATDQISGSDLQFQADIDYGISPRLVQPAELSSYPDDTPAVVTYDAMADPLYGGGWTDFDLPFFGRWAALTHQQVDGGDGGTQRLSVFNGVFDKSQNIWQAASSVAVMGYANLQRIGRKVTGWLDAPDVPVQMFTMGNIAKDSYEKTYLNLEDRSIEVQASFADAADDYKQRNPVRIVAPGAISTAQTAIKTQPVNLFGCTNRVQAYYWTALHLNENVNVLRTHVWKSNAQAVRCRVGNVVWLQHDVPGYGYGGVVMPRSTASKIYFDRGDQPYNTADTWELTIQHPALQVATVNITGIVSGPSGVQVNVAALDGSLQLDRLVQGDVDVAITAVNGTVLTVEDGTGLTAGAAAIWGLDVMETRTVNSLNGNVATVSSPFSIKPANHAQFIYQSTTRKPILVRVKQIKKDPGKQRYTLTAIDYADSNYTIAAPIGLGA